MMSPRDRGWKHGTLSWVLGLSALLSGCPEGETSGSAGAGGMAGMAAAGAGGASQSVGGSGGSVKQRGGRGGVGGGGGTGGTGAERSPDMQAKASLPCDVADVLSRNCAECHGDPPVTAPMSLVTHRDFHRQGASTMDRSVAALVEQRIHDARDPMPPPNAPALGETDLAVLDAWLAAGAPAGEKGDRCKVAAPTDEKEPTGPGALWDDVECYELRNHGQSAQGDDTPYTVPAGEQYVEFYFETPYTVPSVMVGWRTLYDKRKVLHHWLVYQGGNQPPGTVRVGTGAHSNVELLAAWAVGGNDMTLPAGVAAALPPPGGKLFTEWHYFNSTGAPVQDRSGIEICVVPKSQVDSDKIGGVTWVGTENLSLPAQQETTVRSSCTPAYDGLPQDEPVRIFGWFPHMHEIGSHMRTWVKRSNGDVEKLFDKPFSFDNQLIYEQDPVVEMRPGDKLVHDCTFTNTTNSHLAYGPSSNQEMCYMFVFSYPQGALANGAFSLTGSSNTCWDEPLTDTCPACN